MDSFPSFRLLRKRRAKPADWLGLRDWRWDEEALDGCGVESQALQTSHEVASDSFGVASVEVCLTEVGVGCLGGEDAMDGAAELVRDGEEGAHGPTTCAEAMVFVVEIRALLSSRGERAFDENGLEVRVAAASTRIAVLTGRSEERRVGKEWRSGGWAGEVRERGVDVGFVGGGVSEGA